MTKRLYAESMKKWAVRAGLTTASLVFIYFIYLSNAGVIDVTGYSGDSVCAGTEADPCYAYINFTVIDNPGKDDSIYIYPMEYDPWGRETPLEFKPGLKDWKLQRSWGNTWRTIDLHSTWNKNTKYAVKFHEGQSYELRIIGYKENAFEDIKWGFGNVDPVFLGIKKEDVFKKLVSSEVDLDGGEAIFLLNNPFSEMPAKQLTQDFILAKGKQVKEFNVFINKTVEYNVSVYVDKFIKKTCVYDESNEMFDNIHNYSDGDKFDCSYNTSVFDHNETRTKETWEQINKIPSGIHKIKVTAFWGAYLGEQKVDWIPSITISKAASGDKEDKKFTMDKWAWWNSSWAKCRNSTFDHNNVGSDLTDFPVLIKLNSSRVNYSLTQDNGEGIRIVDAACNQGGSVVPYEIELWNERGDSSIWAKVSSLNSSVDTVYSIYYNNSGASDGQNKTGVWSNNYEFVLHNTGLTDSSSNNVNFTNAGTVEVDGLIANAGDFEEDAGDYVLTDCEANPSELTVMVYLKPETLGGSYWYSDDIIDDFDHNSQGDAWLISGGVNGNFVWVTSSDGAGIGNVYSYRGSTTAPGSWILIHGTYSDTNNRQRLFVDGTKADEDVQNSIYSTNEEVLIGAYHHGDSPNTAAYVLYDGLVDETRFSSVERTPDWINATYYSLTDGLLSFGSEESSGPDETPPTYSTNSTNSTVAGTPVMHSLKWEDETELDGFIFQFCNGTYDGSLCGTAEVALGTNTTIAIATGGAVGAYPSLTIDTSGYLHACAYNDTGDDLLYGNNTSGSWTWVTVATAGVFGQFCDVEVDASDKPMIAAYNDTADDVYFCNGTTDYFDGSNDCEAVATAGSIGQYNDLVIYDSEAHIFTFNSSGNALVYFNGTTGSWSAEDSVISAAGYDIDAAVDSSGNFQGTCSYANQEVAYFNGTRGSWTEEEVVGGGLHPQWQFTSMAIDSNDDPHMVYIDYNHTVGTIDGNLTYGNRTAGSWTNLTFDHDIEMYGDDDSSPGGAPSLALTDNNYPLVLAYNKTSGNMRICISNFSTWVCGSLGNVTAGFFMQSYGKGLIWDSTNDKAYGLYYNNTGDDLYLLEWTPTEGTAGGDWVNDSWTNTGWDSVSEWSNVTKLVDSDVGDWIAWKVYANDTSDNWNASSVYSYNTTAAGGDTCDYTSGNFTITCSENCTVDTAYDIGGNWLITTGSGMIYVSANITNFSALQISDGCALNLSTGIKVGG